MIHGNAAASLCLFASLERATLAAPYADSLRCVRIDNFEEILTFEAACPGAAYLCELEPTQPKQCCSRRAAQNDARTLRPRYTQQSTVQPVSRKKTQRCETPP